MALFHLDESGNTNFDKPVSTKTEADIYQQLGLHFITPELREDRGEFDWFEKHETAGLIQESDIKGILHCTQQLE